MLADSKLPTTFWAEAVSTACYVQNRVLVVKPHNKTPYELFRGIKPAIGFMKPFGCHVTILNTLDKLGKFDGKSNEGLFLNVRADNNEFLISRTSLSNKIKIRIDMPYWKEWLADNGKSNDQKVNTTSPRVNTWYETLYIAAPEVNTATSEELMGPIPTTEDTQVEDQEIELGNISPSYESSVQTEG
ncbi:retrovirus-related pol polyprotein from transposon TNT 1-94 [Tanacetum coccineum]